MEMNLKQIQAPVIDWLDETGRLLAERIQSDIRVISNINHVAPVGRGKKIRSTLLFLLSRIKGVDFPSLPEVASCIELFHLSSLIHDDVVDNSELRRGEKTLNNFIGNHMSVLWGDFLFINAFMRLHDLREPFLMDVIYKAAKLMVEGQIIELENIFNLNIQRPVYYETISKKTASLFAAVAHIAAGLGGESTEEQERFYRFGIDMGTIFQISDDMLDIFSEKSGKDRFSDLKEGKITLPYILLMENSPVDSEIRQLLEAKEEEKLLELFQTKGIKKLIFNEMDVLYQRATSFVAQFPPSTYRESLSSLIDFITYREY